MQANETNGINSVWLYDRDKNYGRFASTQMFDDGAHGVCRARPAFLRRACFNAVLDAIIFGAQQTDRSYGRSTYDSDVWAIMTPTPGAANN